MEDGEIFGMDLRGGRKLLLNLTGNYTHKIFPCGLSGVYDAYVTGYMSRAS